MTIKGKTIQIFLPDGNPRGIRIAEITSRTVQAVLIPRSILDEASKRSELDNVGVYILLGSDDAKQLAYIGEAENCLARLKQHHKGKEFWTHALVFISKTQFFTKTHIKFLEWLSCERAVVANRYALENGNSPTKPHVSEPVEADLYDNFETIQILSSTLGYPIFDELRKANEEKIEDLIFCKSKDAVASGDYTEDGLVVFAGSTCNLQETKTAGSWIIGMRQNLINDAVLVKENKVLRFASDHVFSSPSSAAAVVLARRANGWLEWKYEDGRTLDEVKRQ